MTRHTSKERFWPAFWKAISYIFLFITLIIILNTPFAVWHLKQPQQGLLPFGAFYFGFISYLSYGTTLLSLLGIGMGVALECPVKIYLLTLCLSVIPAILIAYFL